MEGLVPTLNDAPEGEIDLVVAVGTHQMQAQPKRLGRAFDLARVAFTPRVSGGCEFADAGFLQRDCGRGNVLAACALASVRRDKTSWRPVRCAPHPVQDQPRGPPDARGTVL